MNSNICSGNQILGTGPDGCPKCFERPHRRIIYPEEGIPVRSPTVDNQRVVCYCPTGPARCTKDMKYCADGQYLNTNANGCRQCLPCPIPVPYFCSAGFTLTRNAALINQCPTYSCKREVVNSSNEIVTYVKSPVAYRAPINRQ